VLRLVWPSFQQVPPGDVLAQGDTCLEQHVSCDIVLRTSEPTLRLVSAVGCDDTAWYC